MLKPSAPRVPLRARSCFMPGTAPTENALEVCLRPKTWARWGTQKWDLAQTFAASTVGKPCKADSGTEAATFSPLPRPFPCRLDPPKFVECGFPVKAAIGVSNLFFAYFNLMHYIAPWRRSLFCFNGTGLSRPHLVGIIIVLVIKAAKAVMKKQLILFWYIKAAQTLKYYA